jgi:uncharacterized phage protein gp47/JayE
MADIPVPRSYQQILAEMIDALTSRTGINNLKVGGPLLSILEAAAQSDTRSTQDIFSLLNSISLDRATGAALQQIGKDEGVAFLGASAATGTVTITDSNLTKISTLIYTGTAAPNSGINYINVADGSNFASSGSIYIGRGTSNLEGPLGYSAKIDYGSYWQLTLSTPTSKFHNYGESVIQAQGGDRTIGAGLLCEIPAGNQTDSIQFSVNRAFTMFDGEDTVTGIGVTATIPGVVGNVPSGSVSSFPSVPFTGAAVTNPSSFTNGTDAESDEDYRERIRVARQSRTKGTALAIKSAAIGVQAPDESARVSSASIITQPNEPTILYIDNGSGYEQVDEGVPYDTIYDAALGGEDLFQLSVDRPVSRAFAESYIAHPFGLANGDTLAVRVDGALNEHTFSEDDFADITNGTAFEVVSSINSNSSLDFFARTSDSGTRVVISSKSESGDDIEVTTPSDSSVRDANDVFDFPDGVISTVNLYKNDTLLYKNGKQATVLSASIVDWAPTITDGDTLVLAVDGTPQFTVTVSDSDFANNTEFNTVDASNSLASWAIVLTKLITGVTATVTGSSITLTSNKGYSSEASIVIDDSSTLVTKGMFTDEEGLSDTGKDSDFTFNRFTGQGKLSTALEEGDKLTAGIGDTRAYIESDEFANGTVTLTSPQKFFVIVDGDAEIIDTGLTNDTDLTVTAPTEIFNAQTQYYLKYDALSAVFGNLRQGDWAIIWDPNFVFAESGTNYYAYRIAEASANYFRIQTATSVTPVGSGSSATSGGIVFVRSEKQVQRILTTLSGSQSIAAVASSLNSSLKGCTAEVFKNTKLRLRTNTYGADGDIMLVTADTNAQVLELPVGVRVDNQTPHVAVIESTNAQTDIPDFASIGYADANNAGPAAPNGGFTMLGATVQTDVKGHNALVFLKPFENSGTVDRYGTNKGGYQYLSATAASSVTRSTNTETILVSSNAGGYQDRFYISSLHSITPYDKLSLTVDNDTELKSYSIPLYRKIQPKAGETYVTGTSAFEVLDQDNGGQSLGVAFGAGSFFTDFALYMRARVKTHNSTASNRILWRHFRYGPEGNNCRIRYVYPRAAGLDVAVTCGNRFVGGTTATRVSPVVDIQLASDSAISVPNLFASNRFSVAISTTHATNDTAVFTANQRTVSTSSRTSNVISITTDAAHGLSPGDVIYVSGLGFTTPAVSGAQTLITASGSTLTFASPSVTNEGPFAVGTVDYAPTFPPNFSGLLTVGDIVNVSSSSPFSSSNEGAFKITALTTTSFTVHGLSASGGFVAQTNIRLNNPSYLSFYSLDATANLATTLVASVNALSGVGVSAVFTGSGATAITKSSADAYIDATGTGDFTEPFFTFQDGINSIKDAVLDATNSIIGIKDPVSSSLTGTSSGAFNDFDNEIMYLVPRSVETIRDYLNKLAVSGLSSDTGILASSNANKLQIKSLSFGSEGTVQVSGSTANADSIPVIGSITNNTIDSSAKSFCLIDKSRADSLTGGQMVQIDATVKTIKKEFTTSHSLAISNLSGSTWLIDTSVSGLWALSGTAVNSSAWAIEKQGKYTALVAIGDSTTNLSTIGLHNLIPGGWIEFKQLNGSSTILSGNLGSFKILNVIYSNTSPKRLVIFFENPNAVEQNIFLNTTNESIKGFDGITEIYPGDQLVINSSNFADANNGIFTITALHASDTDKFYVTGEMETQAATSPMALGEIYIKEGVFRRLVNQMYSILPYFESDGSLTDYYQITFSKNSDMPDLDPTITPLGKLEFPTSLSRGTDGYSKTVGLIGEVSKVIYGDERDSVTYPGVASADTDIDIRGPVIRKIKMSLLIRLTNELEKTNIISRVKNAVATTINSSSMGQSIPLSDIVEACSKVSGVFSVMIQSPTYSVTNDFIQVQSYEKALVLDVENDITVNIVGG